MIIKLFFTEMVDKSSDLITSFTLNLFVKLTRPLSTCFLQDDAYMSVSELA